jgi:hypothetical protein
VSIDGVWIWVLDLLTQLGSTSNTELRLIITIYESPQHLLSLLSACCAFNRRSLETAPNSGDSLPSVPTPLLYGEYPATYLSHSPINYFTSIHSTELYTRVCALVMNVDEEFEVLAAVVMK